MSSPRRALAVVLWATAVTLVATTEILHVSGTVEGRTYAYTFLGVSGGLAYPALGLIILRRHPQHLVGWVFVALGCWAAVHLTLGQVALWIGHGPFAGTLAVASEAIRVVALSGLIFLLLIYPTGHLLSRRWRWAAWAIAFLWLEAIAILITPRAIPEFGLLRGPVRSTSMAVVAEALGAIATVGFAGLVAAIVSLVIRFRRARSVERQQIKLFAFVAITFIVVIGTATLAFPKQVEEGWLGEAVWNPPIVLLPAAAAYAILRHGLYEIDRVISRTLAYGIVTVALAGPFALVTIVPTAVVGSGDTPDWLIAGATLVVAALFRPIRRGAQAIVDRRFNRARYDAARTIESFASRLREETDIDALGAELQTLVDITMQPAHISLWVRGGKT